MEIMYCVQTEILRVKPNVGEDLFGSCKSSVLGPLVKGNYLMKIEGPRTMQINAKH